ncbi:MAG: SH3 domain-containing protein, partial [Caldilineaceae bacterium]|nr:SH3 domain-containing protein [Caldilineaceae bacterium]
MSRHSKLPARFLLVLLGTILILAGMTSVSLANWTDYHEGYFEMVEAGSNHAWFLLHWGILEGWCDDVDHNCAVKVTGTPSATTGDPVTRWLDELSMAKTIDIGCGLTFGHGNERYAEFENCMEVQKSGFTVHWPTVKPNDAFEITPFCKSGDEVCSVELRICFNAADCENNNYRKRRWSKVGDFWDDFLSVFRPSCLYDDDEDDVWECINDEFVDWRLNNLPRNGDYDDLVDQAEDERGFVVMNYKNNLNDVSDRSIPFQRYETSVERNQRQSTPTAVPALTPTPISAQPTVSTATSQNTPLPTVPVTNSISNLREGPGTVYQIVGQLDAGTSLTPVARNGDGTWLQLDVGVWIWASLVNNIPVDLPLAANIPQIPDPTATPEPTATPPPAFTPTPAPTAVPTATPV